jgi:aldehyde dehydrogenase (NAD+)
LEHGLAWICGDVCVWKPSEKTPLCGIACQNIIAEVIKENNLPEGISCLINGDYKVEMMTSDKRVPLISATGSTLGMGKIAQTVVV